MSFILTNIDSHGSFFGRKFDLNSSDSDIPDASDFTLFYIIKENNKGKKEENKDYIARYMRVVNSKFQMRMILPCSWKLPLPLRIVLLTVTALAVLSSFIHKQTKINISVN